MCEWEARHDVAARGRIADPAAALQRYIEDRDEQGRRRVRVVPVLLPGVPREPQLPAFLRGFDLVDLRTHGPDDRDQIRRLVAAILGDRPGF